MLIPTLSGPRLFGLQTGNYETQETITLRNDGLTIAPLTPPPPSAPALSLPPRHQTLPHTIFAHVKTSVANLKPQSHANENEPTSIHWYSTSLVALDMANTKIARLPSFLVQTV